MSRDKGTERQRDKAADGADLPAWAGTPISEALHQLQTQHDALSALAGDAPGGAQVTAALTHLACAIAKLEEARAAGQRQAEKSPGAKAGD